MNEQSEKSEPQLDRHTLVYFCVSCFASEDNSSYGEMVFPDYCCNCGAGGGQLQIARWQVEEIRRNASWVGKRYYPNEEDKERHAERLRLLALVPNFPGRSAERIPNGELVGRWWVNQRVAENRVVSTVVEAASAEEALELARFSSLPYDPCGSAGS